MICSFSKICQVQVVGKEGDAPCVGTIDSEGAVRWVDSAASKGFTCDLKDNLRCDATSKCARVQDVGGSCSEGAPDECAKAADCDITKGQCVARLPLGATCNPGGPSNCTAGYCDRRKTVCTASAADGAPCNETWQCASNRECRNGKCSKLQSLESKLAFVCNGGEY